MDLTSWAFYAFIVLIALGGVVAHYRLREPPGRGRPALATLRWLAIALLVLLLFDPVLPTTATARGGETLALVDASLSMRLPDTLGTTRWDAASRAVSAARASRVLLFGGDEVRQVGSLEGVEPVWAGSRLAPAVRAAAERGGAEVVVVTDGALEDPDAAARLAETAGLAVRVVRVGDEPRWNAGIVEAEASPWAEVGVESEVRFGVATIGRGPDSVVVALRREGVELGRVALAVAAPGLIAAGSLRFTPTEAASEPVRLDVVLVGEDAEPDDDARSVYIRVSEAPTGVALISFRPDQEPRFLLPVIERAVGVPTRGWMALGGSYITLGEGVDAGRSGTEAAVRRAVREADLLVLHGLDAEAPDWALAAARAAPRLLVFPAGAQAAGLPVELGPARPGDWYLSPDIPSSPVAPMLAGLEPGDAPPLTSLRAVGAPAGFWSPLDARLGRRGAEQPVVVAGSPAGRRVAIAAGEGYWRWAFAGGAPRDAYDRLWSALAGWLLEETTAVTAELIRPVDRVVARGSPLRFRAPPAADSVRLRLHAAAGAPDDGSGEGDGVVPLDTVLAVTEGAVTGPVLPPGHYRYDARAVGTGETGGRFEAGGAEAGGAEAGGAEAGAAVGELTVERYSAEFTRPVRSLPDVLGTGSDGPTVGRAGGRPLRASPWPYVLLIALLCAEWALRRKWGLR